MIEHRLHVVGGTIAMKQIDYCERINMLSEGLRED
jgi:hypothetical protein